MNKITPLYKKAEKSSQYVQLTVNLGQSFVAYIDGTLVKVTIHRIIGDLVYLAIEGPDDGEGLMPVSDGEISILEFS